MTGSGVAAARVWTWDRTSREVRSNLHSGISGMFTRGPRVQEWYILKAQKGDPYCHAKPPVIYRSGSIGLLTESQMKTELEKAMNEIIAKEGEAV